MTLLTEAWRPPVYFKDETRGDKQGKQARGITTAIDHQPRALMSVLPVVVSVLLAAIIVAVVILWKAGANVRP